MVDPLSILPGEEVQGSLLMLAYQPESVVADLHTDQEAERFLGDHRPVAHRHEVLTARDH